MMPPQFQPEEDEEEEMMGKGETVGEAATEAFATEKTFDANDFVRSDGHSAEGRRSASSPSQFGSQDPTACS
jgi:hypothetical protein